MEVERGLPHLETEAISSSKEQPTNSEKNWLFRYHAIAAGIILLVAVVLRFSSQEGERQCTGELNDGHWNDHEGDGVYWHPNNCTVHHFMISDLDVCMAKFPRVVVFGEEKWESEAAILCRTTDTKSTKSRPCTMQYISHPNTCGASDKVLEEYNRLAKSTQEQGPVLVIHQSYFHYVFIKSDKDLPPTCKGAIQAQIKAQIALLAASPHNLIVQLDSNSEWIPSDTRGTDFTGVFKELYRSAERNSSRLLYLTTPFQTGFGVFQRVQYMSLPNNDNKVPQDLSMVLNSFCTSLLSNPLPSYCCAHYSHSHYFAITVLVCIFAMYLGVVLILLSGATFALIPHLEAVNFNLEAFISVLHSIGGGALVMFYVLMTDGVGYFMSVERSYSVRLFVLCVLAIVVMALLSCRKVETAEFLSVSKCNALRGVMILLHIALQYCSMDRFISGRLFGDLMVGGIVFISGYTHFIFCWKHADFTWKRLATVLFRLNILPVLLSLTLGSSSGVFHLSLLLTLGFLFTFVFMASWPQMTPASMQSLSVRGPQHVAVVVKFGLAFFLVFFLPHFKDLIQGVVNVNYALQSHTGSTDTLYDWVYKHRYMTVGGMAFGYVVCNIQSNSSATIEGLRRFKVVKTVFSVLILLGYGVFLVRIGSKDYAGNSDSQSLIAGPVVLSCVFLLSFFDSYESSVLADLGSSVIWLFISYQHILLSENSSAMLLLFPRQPRLVNTALVVCVFLFCQRLMSSSRQIIVHYATSFAHTQS